MTPALARRFISPISSPGPRLLQRGLLSVRRLRRKRGQPALGLELSMVPLVDCLLSLVLFLLASFNVDAECGHRQRVPSAHNTDEMVEAPIVVITEEAILLDSTPTGNARQILEGGRLTRIEGLLDALKSKRELWGQLNPGRAFPGAVILEVDRRVPSLVVKSAFQTAVFAGYPNISFLVRKR